MAQNVQIPASTPPEPPQAPQKTRRTICGAHCSGCGRHFSGDSAFTLHRIGSFQKGTRRCADPATLKDKDGKPRLVAKSEDGHCSLGIGFRGEVHGVTVWQTREASEASWDA